MYSPNSPTNHRGVQRELHGQTRGTRGGTFQTTVAAQLVIAMFNVPKGSAGRVDKCVIGATTWVICLVDAVQYYHNDGVDLLLRKGREQVAKIS
jgi:hypothetical protein